MAADLRTGVLRVDYPSVPPVTRLDARPSDLGFAGAALAQEDNATTGGFMGHGYALETVAVAPEGADAALDALLAEGIGTLVILARDADLLRLADRAGPEVLVLNAAARGTALRDGDCRANVLHVTPSVAMLADAAVQFAAWKKWTRLYLIHGSNPQDLALAEAYRRAAARFGARIVEEREFEDTGGARRTDSGHVMVQRQLPVFTQDAREHDVVIAADASDVFARYLPFHLWDPRPVIGSAGLQPVSFDPALEAWGATQFQRRFEALTGRRLAEADYDTWLALRVLGEAVTRTGSADPATLRAYALSEEFELAAFKGQKVTFRPWNGQLRQPVLLFDGRITASVSPQEGFLHQVSPLDTLGLDAPDSACGAFGGG
ncbi:ABC transporter substrate-binding protein [Mangrovicoccus sp. HB182678]|uniref:ABC transporter substrate-binding protein n=2 Tax=Mangrovicoccus algicola TaxID=2771008 RepID=A0A8J6YVU2_9RHOB|nr:ABC transporter substrate-binding protein [Mangrovicoccus algicola]MBE3636998.1 ABC transporter substrate-binding protein [Mangrovicoccus algicola]